MSYQDGQAGLAGDVARPSPKSEMRTVLIVEDDPFLSLHLEMVIEENGLAVAGTAPGIDEALAAIETLDPNVAILDVNLRGSMVFPVARRLNERGIPFAFVTAYSNDDSLFPEDLRAAPRCTKPVNEGWLIDILKRLAAKP